MQVDREDSGSGRSPGGRHGNPLHYSCLENPMDREESGRLQSMRLQSQTWLSDRASTLITSLPPLKMFAPRSMTMKVFSWPLHSHPRTCALAFFYRQLEKQRRIHDKSVRMVESFEGLDLWIHESLTVNWARNCIFFHWVGSLQTQEEEVMEPILSGDGQCCY